MYRNLKMGPIADKSWKNVTKNGQELNPILTRLLNTLQNHILPPLLIRLFFTLEAQNLACRVCLVLSFDFNFKIFKILMYDITMTSFLCFHRCKGRKAKTS